jgi:hypothetical protein
MVIRTTSIIQIFSKNSKINPLILAQELWVTISKHILKRGYNINTIASIPHSWIMSCSYKFVGVIEFLIMFIWQVKCVKKNSIDSFLVTKVDIKGEGFKVLELCQVVDVEHKFFIINLLLKPNSMWTKFLILDLLGLHPQGIKECLQSLIFFALCNLCYYIC